MDNLEKLLKGNEDYLNNQCITDCVLREETSKKGQHPYATIITCSDSRVIPEKIFNANIGELFIIRVAGNVIGEHELGSIEYAVEHLKTKLVVVLGHTQCGAVDAAIHNEGGRYIDSLVKPIKLAIGQEKDAIEASKKNAINGRDVIKEKINNPEIDVEAMLYDIVTGEVKVL